jgi:hypothetical protein
MIPSFSRPGCRRRVVEVLIGKRTVNDEEQRDEVGQVVQWLPTMTADLRTVNGRDDGESEEVEGNGAEQVDRRLLRRGNRERDVEQREAFLLEEEQRDGMRRGQRQAT